MHVPEEARRGLDGYTTSKKVPLLTVLKEIVHGGGGWGEHLLFERNISDYIYMKIYIMKI